jgi:hypothetical protein
MTPRVRLPVRLDLSLQGEMLTAPAKAAILETLGRIPGLAITDIRAERASAQTTCVSIEARGWGPTLHEAKSVLVLRLHAPPEEHLITRDEIARAPAFLRFARLQEGRAKAALDLGLSAPLKPGGDTVPTGRLRSIRRKMPTEVRHLLVDAALPSVLATAGEDPLADLSDGLWRIYEASRTLLLGGDADGLCRDGDIWVQEVSSDMLGLGIMPSVTLRVIGRAGVLEVPEGMTGSYDGRELLLTGHGIPETVLTVMPGMRLGDVIDLHPALADRVISKADVDDEGQLRISLVTDLVPLTEAVQAVSDAQEH